MPATMANDDSVVYLWIVCKVNTNRSRIIILVSTLNMCLNIDLVAIIRIDILLHELCVCSCLVTISTRDIPAGRVCEYVIGLCGIALESII